MLQTKRLPNSGSSDRKKSNKPINQFDDASLLGPIVNVWGNESPEKLMDLMAVMVFEKALQCDEFGKGERADISAAYTIYQTMRDKRDHLKLLNAAKGQF